MRKPSYSTFFPEGSNKQTIAGLQKLVRQCTTTYTRTQSKFLYPSLKIPETACTLLAEILIDFALDIHSGSGIWTALEKCNTELFGTPLPLIHNGKIELPPGICVERVQFLLWNLYEQFEECNAHVAPHHPDLLLASQQVTKFLTEHLTSLPNVSPIKSFLDKPNDYGWEIKKKLIWLGMNSYLFRLHFGEYMDKNYDGGESIPVIDDFICQNTTSWSGLGVIDILAACLDIPDGQREELRSWYIRHVAIYKIVKVDKEVTEAVNLINNASYRIREGASSNPRKNHTCPNMILYGSLTPWRGEWYWSGTLRDLTQFPADAIADTIKRFTQQTRFVARYCKEREETVLQRGRELYQQALKFYDNDLNEFSSGKAFQRAEMKWLMAHAKELGHGGHMPDMRLPKKFLANNNGIGMFIDPVEGTEMMESFNDVKSGLKKNGKGCTEDEADIIRGFIYSQSICPAFVYRVLKEYGGEDTVKSVFCLKTDEPYWLDYLLRCHKGEFYRRRIPSIDIVDTKADQANKNVVLARQEQCRQHQK